MNPDELANAYQSFFFKSEAGQEFINTITTLETNHLDKAQKQSDLNELGKSSGNHEVIDHIRTVIAQSAVNRSE